MIVNVPYQGIGGQFQLMPGETLIRQEQMTRMIFPAKATTMYLTSQRLVFCDISRALTIGVSWLFWYMAASKISQSFTRADIADVHLETSFIWIKKVAITSVNRETFRFRGNGFDNNAVNAVMQWYSNPPV